VGDIDNFTEGQARKRRPSMAPPYSTISLPSLPPYFDGRMLHSVVGYRVKRYFLFFFRARKLYPELHFASFIADSAHDNYPIYNLLRAHSVNSIIALN